MVDFSSEEEEPTSLADEHSFTVEADKIAYADVEDYQNRMLEDLAMLSFRYTLDFCRNLMAENPGVCFWSDPLTRTLDPPWKGRRVTTEKRLVLKSRYDKLSDDDRVFLWESLSSLVVRCGDVPPQGSSLPYKTPYVEFGALTHRTSYLSGIVDHPSSELGNFFDYKLILRQSGIPGVAEMASLSDEAGCANILKLLCEGEETIGILRELSSDSSYRTMREKEEKYDKILLAREEYVERKATVKHKNLVRKAMRESGFVTHYREEFSHMPKVPVRDGYLSPLLVALGASLHSADIRTDVENLRRLNMLKGKLSARNLGVIVLDSPTKVTKVWVCENFEMLKKHKELMDNFKGSVPTVF